MLQRILFFVLVSIFFAASVTRAGEPAFSRDIRPILADNCYQCHGPDEEARQADMRLDRREDLLVAVGDTLDLASSEILRRINSDDPDEVMPPPSTRRSLSKSQRGMIRSWLESGAKWEGHWSFETPRRPALPNIDNATNAVNEIDHFILRRLRSESLVPAEAASREKLLRRVTLDLTGLPPTLEEIDSFTNSKSDNAYANVVEKLLASPRYGERMSMEWLDAARYADTNGYQGDRERTMWPWRDWVIDALNRNLPFDEFTQWQLAGDQLPNATHEQKLATGFCRNHMINGEGGRIAEENRVEYIFDQIETLGTVWMGLTVQCCRCHDHKFDPLAQSEYYKLFAFFNQTPIDGGGGDPQMAPNLAVPTTSQQAAIDDFEAELKRAEERLVSAEEKIQCDDGSIPKDVKTALDEVIAKRSGDHWTQLEQHFADQHPKLVSLGKQYRETQDKLNQSKKRVPKVMIMQDMAKAKHRETFTLNKGLYNQQRDPVVADIPSFLPQIEEKEKDRLTLARWLTSNEHPLTARVTVNRIWQTFFGTGLVRTSDDFGVQGEKPSHPELLDWLACEVVDSGWDTKHIVRLIVMSSTYQQSANVSERLLEQDPENRLLARGPRMRMPAWMIRDHALAASAVLAGELGGPSVKPYQPAGIWAETSFGNKKYQQDYGDALYRRSLYIYWRRIVGPTMFFDMSKRQTCSVKSGRTNTPLHALVTLNDTTYVEAARVMATRVMQAEQDPIVLAFRLATSRRPTQDELNLLKQRLDQLLVHYSAYPDEAAKLVKVGEMPAPASIDTSELASYTTLCLMILNLDEALNK